MKLEHLQEQHKDYEKSVSAEYRNQEQYLDAERKKREDLESQVSKLTE